MTRRPFRVRRARRAALLAFVVAASPAALPAAPAGAALIPIASFTECAEGILKNSAGLLKKRTSALSKCSAALLKCKLDDELGDGDFSSCSIAAAASCNKALDKLPLKEESTVETKIADACGGLPDSDVLTSVGIGYRRNVRECGTMNSADEARECTLERIRCRAADIVETLQPRTYELLDASGLLLTRPDDTDCFDERSPATPTTGDPKAIASCSSKLAKTLSKPMVSFPKDYAACLADTLGCRLRGDRLLNGQQPPACYSGAPDADCTKAYGKMTVASGAELVTKAVDACAAVSTGDMLGAIGFDWVCGGMTNQEITECVRDVVLDRSLWVLDDVMPRTCEIASEAGSQAAFATGDFCSPHCGDRQLDAGETCDDGNGDPNDECTNECETGPTVHTTHTIPASSAPAHTPDGTMANAVPLGSSVYNQFGTQTPDLNNVLYTRYRATGAGDPDAVLVLVPGFAGGAHSLKIVAETMVAKAAAESDLVLEVWAFDRRTDQLEDDYGGELAEQLDDPEIAMDWYFGSELGLTLDPMLPRRAEFHAGSDIAFIANFTYNMFIHDIDDVVEAAAALPSSPAVFLGGHSLGTLFSARYAATDLDPGPGLEPGHDKVAGLVLFEGGGDSMPTGSPTADQLDLVIAKFEGGLYHAIRNNAASCYDGTPCPNGDADCAALALPAGALSNKCVSPVPAYAGGVISPEIHAVGDAVVLQARRHPDSLSIAQIDYGIGTAVENVAGLSILGALPPSSSESSVGFFLDDDYSPEVSFQASMGFSDNGVNADLVDFYLALEAENDPYRLWDGTTAPQNFQAVPNHGAPTGPFDLNGLEKEITPMDNVLTMVRSGDRNIGDWYFPAAGLGLTKELIVPQDAGFVGGLDSTPLSVGRGRSDIENLTEGPNIDIPIISFGGSNGISPTRGAMLPFAESIGLCTSPSCDGTPRIVATDPINPTYGGAAGGFESYVAEGYAHIDVVSAEDNASHNNVYAPLLAFLDRNVP